eukprot:scaffold421402_cov48-Attheya_sp.AAC.3
MEKGGMYKVAVIKEKGGDFCIEERPIPTPGPEEVLVKVLACGMCHSDSMVVNNGMAYPRVPGHEVVGHVASVGERVQYPSAENNPLVGVGWHGSHCFHCSSCRRGDFMVCPNATVTGLDTDGGYGEYMLAHWSAVCELPPDIEDPAAAAPLLCAGTTMFNGMRRQSHLVPGDLVAIQGIGGLGHLGIQFAKRMGYRVAAISSNSKKQKLAQSLGADYFIDTSVDLDEPPSIHLQALGGCALVIATAPSSKSMQDLVNGLAPNGRLMVVGADADTFAISPLQLIGKRTHVCGWSSGCATDSEDTCAFAHSQGIQSKNEYFPLSNVQKAYDRMMSGEANCRVVLKIGK